MAIKSRIKPVCVYAVLVKMFDKVEEYPNYNKMHLEYAFTWDKKHPEEKYQKSQKVMAIYPTKKQALKDMRFRGGDLIKKMILR